MNLGPLPGEALGVLAVVTVAFTVFHYGAHASTLRRLLRPDDPAAQARSVHLQRLGGVLLLGVAPALVVVLGLGGDLRAFGLGVPGWGETAAFAVGVPLLVAPIIWRQAASPTTWAHYPQIRSRRWSPALFRDNALGWVGYLTAYEFFFRGFLLFAMARWVGPWGAIGITTMAYVFAHLPKYAGETFGTIPMGVAFAWITLRTGAIWAAVGAHLAIANFSDWAAVRRNPGREGAGGGGGE